MFVVAFNMKALLQHKDKIGIYCIFNKVNQKVYIGKSKNIYKRIIIHKSALIKKDLKQENQHFISAWNKYGEENFIYIVLEFCKESELGNKELLYMDLFKSINPLFGYNKRYDSGTNTTMSEESKLKNSNSQKEIYKNNPELKQIRIQSIKNWRKTNPELVKIADLQSGNKRRKYKIAKLDKKTGLILEIFETRKILKDNYPEYYIQAILGCCQGFKKSAYGFHWVYLDRITNEIQKRIINK